MTTRGRLTHDEGATVIASAHHLPPPIAGFTFLRHLRSTLSHDTFVAERRSGELFAVRVYALAYLKRHEQRRNMVEREVLVGQAARHPHVAECVQPFATRTDLFTAERYYAGGELFESVESYYRSSTGTGADGGLPLSVAGRLFRELLRGLLYLHEGMGLAHRNVKLENVLLDEGNGVRLSGLGMCAVTVGEAEGEPVDVLLRLCCGSKHYVAPELLDGQPYEGPAVDLWAAGVVLFALVTGAFPFDAASDRRSSTGNNASNTSSKNNSTSVAADEAIFDQVRRGEEVLDGHAAFRALPDPQLQDLLRGLLRANPAVRLSAAEALEHPFLAPAADAG